MVSLRFLNVAVGLYLLPQSYIPHFSSWPHHRYTDSTPAAAALTDAPAAEAAELAAVAATMAPSPA